MSTNGRRSIDIETDPDGRKVISQESADFLHEWAAAHNLSEIVNFHNVIRACLAEKATEFDGDDVDDRVVRSALDDYQGYLAKATFLMVYAYFEEDVYLLWKWQAKHVKRGPEKSIRRYEPVLERLGFDLHHSSWESMLEATDLRHSLIHANGRLDHARNRQRLDEITAKYPGELSAMHSRLQMNAEYVSRVLGEVRSFQDEAKRARLEREAPDDAE